MKKISDWLFGYYRVTISGGSPQWCLNRLTKARIPFWDIRWDGEFQVTVSVFRKNLDAVICAAEAAMCTAERVREKGAPQRYRGIRRRICLLIMLTAAICTAVIVPRFVWFYEVEGNVTVPSEKIIRTVQQCGVTVGTYGKNIEPQKIKDMVLAKLPELAWLTVTQSGGRAAIVVREKTFPENVPDRRSPQNIVASQSGMVTSVSVLEGSAAVKPGDMVQEGQLLISGYMDLEYKYRVCGALGEVYARTWREIRAVTPEKTMKKTYTGEEKTVTYLCFGRKRIKISLGSGIFPTGCDKMSKETFFTLPGDLQLPVSVIKERYVFYEPEEAAVPQKKAETILHEAAVSRTQKDMVAGVIEETQWDLQREKGNYIIQTTLQCTEMIGRAVEAEIFKGEMQHDGTSNQRGTVGAAH